MIWKKLTIETSVEAEDLLAEYLEELGFTPVERERIDAPDEAAVEAAPTATPRTPWKRYALRSASQNVFHKRNRKNRSYHGIIF